MTLLQSPASAAALHRRGLLVAMIGVTAWSFGGLLARSVEASTWTILCWRSLFACLFLFGYVAWQNQGRVLEPFRRLGLHGAVVGCCFGFASSCFITALGMTTVGRILMYQAAAPFIAGIMAWLFIRERVALHTWAAILVALGGVLVMVWDSLAGGKFLGDLLAIIMTTLTAIAIVIMRRHREVRMTPAACLGTGIAFLVGLTQAQPITELGHLDIGLLMIFGVVQMGIGLILFTTGARMLPAAETGLMTVLESILAPLWVWLVVSEHPGDATLIGGAVIVAALIVHTVVDLQRERVVPPAI